MPGLARHNPDVTGQAGDWMAELYPRWVAAHAVFIAYPVHWYQAPASLKLMMDRLVCTDGGNPDFTSTGGKDPEKAKHWNSRGGAIPSTSPAAPSRSWRTATRRGRRTCGGGWSTGSPTSG
jgi:multimeric flavodoxin WrbA